MSEQNCQFEGCTEPVHAKGYCRKHYARVWRERGKEAAAAAEGGDAKPTGRRGRKASSERRKALNYELSTARKMYESVVGIASRIKWRKRIRWLETELRGLESDVDELM
jgi:hypothetical protein